jgi:hypothetical protein
MTTNQTNLVVFVGGTVAFMLALLAGIAVLQTYYVAPRKQRAEENRSAGKN